MFEKHLLDICNQREEKSIHLLKLDACFLYQTDLSLNLGSLKTGKSLSWIAKFLYIYAFNLAMAIHSSTLAWEIPWTAEPGRLQSMGS